VCVHTCVRTCVCAEGRASPPHPHPACQPAWGWVVTAPAPAPQQVTGTSQLAIVRHRGERSLGLLMCWLPHWAFCPRGTHQLASQVYWKGVRWWRSSTQCAYRIITTTPMSETCHLLRACCRGRGQSGHPCALAALALLHHQQAPAAGV